MAYLKRSTGTIVKSTAAELNKMSGVTASTAELNIMDGVTSTAAELNIMDGVTSTAAELNICDGKTGIPDEVVLQRKFTKVNQQGHLSFTGSSGWTRHPKYNDLEFTFTPKSTSSKLILEYTYGLCHASGGGYGYCSFMKNGGRATWVNGGGQSGWSDSYGHFVSGGPTTGSGYYSSHSVFVSENNSISAFTMGLELKWSNGGWYYAHDGSYHVLSVTEILN